jgi:hypothetical protein
MNFATPTMGDEFFIWLNDGTDAIGGARFTNAPTEGAFIPVGSGGDGFGRAESSP